jgi:hypothetical protein
VLSIWYNSQREEAKKLKTNEEVTEKPTVICDYNKNMVGVDVADQYKYHHTV